MWYLAIVMVISVGFSISIYHFATNELTFGLHHQTQRIFQQYPVFNSDPFLRSQGTDITEGARHILERLIYFNVLVLVGAGFASYRLARRTLGPIEEAHERQKRFTADVSHELRTPLTSLKMGSEVALMDMQADKRELRGALESNLEDAAKMDLLINNLLRLTKLDAQEAQNSFVQVKSADVVHTAIEQVKQSAQAKNIIIQNNTREHTITGDAETLTQLLVILLDNAIKYSPAKSNVIIDSKQHADSLLLTVKDEGKGIDPKALPHVFDRFYRADGSRNKAVRESEGFGLGLSIAKLIADQHDGSITLTSRPGKGTTAEIALPIVHGSGQ